MIPHQHPMANTMDMADSLFAGTGMIIIAVESDSLFSPEVLEKYSSFHDSLENLQLISRVYSLYSHYSIVPKLEEFVINKTIDSFPDDDSLRNEFIKELEQTDIIESLISSDLKKMSFLCRMGSAYDFEETVFRDRIVSIIRHYEDPERIYYSGFPIMRADVIDSMRKDLVLFTPFALGLMMILLILSFRSWAGVFLPFFVVGISVIWTFGLMGWLDMSVPFIGGLIPVMLIAIANDYGIHIISHFFEYSRMDKEATRGAILRKTIQKLGMPIFIAAMTTIVSFLGLATHVLPRVREMGFLISFGIFVAFILSVFIIPSVLVLLTRPTFLSKKSDHEKINNALVALGDFFIRFRVSLLLGLSVIAFILGSGIRDIKVDTNPDHYFPKNGRLRIHNTAISDAFGGATQLTVMVEGDIYEPETLKNIETLTNHISESSTLVTKTHSITDVIKNLHFGFNGGDSVYYTIPDDRELITQYMFLFSLTGNTDEFDFILDDWEDPSFTQIFIRLRQVQTIRIAEIVEDTEQFIQANFYDQSPMQLTGPAAFLGVLTRLVVKGQIISLFISALIIFIIMSFVFRSIVGGLLAVLPMATSVLLVFGVMGHLGIVLNMTTSLLTSILVGVGVDYTVHFLWHLRDHIRSGESIDDAIRSTFRISGKGILFNAASVILGFTALLFSEFLPVVIFGILVMASITFCLFGALAVLPALISWVNPKFLYK
ncbi:MAG: RND family transporter [Candidatus Marinimicrobia bacterium]|nr:RND family transporter [Candidatus Neomarinimicrobiota bacterium]MBT7899858.1 RND family transporter [Candidatus Neomarinimicrobiota bacterium]